MTPLMWMALAGVLSVAVLAVGILVGGASVYVHLQKHHPEAWRVLQADCAEERASKRFAARRSASTSTAREW